MSATEPGRRNGISPERREGHRDATAPAGSAPPAAEGGNRRGPVTAADFVPPPKDWRRIPALTTGGVRLVWRASRSEVLLFFGLQVAAGALMGLQLLLARNVLQQLIELNRTGAGALSVLPEFLALIGVIAAFGICGALAAHRQQLLVELVGVHVFDRIIDVSSAVDLERFETPDFYDQLQRARTSGMARAITMLTSLSTVCTGVVTSVGIGVALLIMEPLLVPTIVLAAVPVFLSTLVNSRQTYAFEYGMTAQGRERMYLMELLTRIQAAKEVRVFAAIGFLRRRYDALTSERVERMRLFVRQRLKVSMVGTLGGAAGISIALLVLVALLGAGRIDVATAVVAGAAMQQLSARLNATTLSLGKLIESGMFLDDYSAFLDLEPERAANGASPARQDPRVRPSSFEDPESSFQGLSVEGVSFTYPNTDVRVLDDVSLQIGPGEVIALVGENGSGKTTLVKLICQLYQPGTGRVLWQGADEAAAAPRVRDDMTVIFQDFVQYHLSAADNIALGRVEREPTPEAIEAAAGQAGAHGFISALPQGYQTRLGRQFYGGYELSIGQWQRVALARAFFRGGDFLVLDEPTAALDPRAEQDLFAQMRRLSAGRSVLLVSHRFSSVRTADRIYVLDKGRVTEAGSHEELLELGGQYAELFTLQAAAYLDSPTTTGG